MKLSSRFRLVVLAILPALFVVEKSAAQVGIVVSAGQQRSLAVVPHPGETYAWRIYNKSTLLPTDLVSQSEAEYTASNNQPVLPVIWKKQGEYFYTVTVFNMSGCKNLKAGYVKVVSPPFSAVAGRDTIVGVCSSYLLDASKSVGDRLTFQWDLLDPGGVLSSYTSSRTSLTISPAYKGVLPLSIRIRLTVTNGAGLSSKDTVKVSFGAPPMVGIIYPDNPNKDGSMLIDGTASTGKGLKYHWTATKGEIVSDASKSKVLIRGAGIYSLEVTDQFGCKSSKVFNYPFEPNELVANADYVRSSWMDSIRINVLNNDYDSRNDIDKRTLSILRKPMYGNTQLTKEGVVIYIPDKNKAFIDQFVYQICDSVNLCDTAKVTIDIYDGPVWIPEAISVNGDGHNDTFVIRGLEAYPNTSLMIYTRAGQLIYKSDDYNNDWDGHALNSSLSDGITLPVGTYYYVLHLGGTNRYIKGFVYLSH